MKIYTKTGDLGETGIMGGGRRAKSDLRIAAIGEVDELNASIGWTMACETWDGLSQRMERVQNWMFELGAELASPGDSRFESIVPRQIEDLEQWIDQLTSELPELKNFILPGGSELASRFHVARAVCRRAERAVVALAQGQEVRPVVLAFLNRLADLLFVLARTANHKLNVSDVSWTKGE